MAVLKPHLTDVIKVRPQPLRPAHHRTILAAFVETEETGRRVWEQLWSMDVGDGKYELRCVPFTQRAWHSATL